jgi:hypothetical protein
VNQATYRIAKNLILMRCPKCNISPPGLPFKLIPIASDDIRKCKNSARGNRGSCDIKINVERKRVYFVLDFFTERA